MTANHIKILRAAEQFRFTRNAGVCPKHHFTVRAFI
jgi:hypothetical protein